MAFGSSTPLSIKGRALRLLSQREHSRAELERKLAAHEVEPGSLARALDDLVARGFIDEGRVVESVINRRADRLGAVRIRHELNAKGLAPEAVAQAVAGLKSTEAARAGEVRRRRFGDAPPPDAAAAAKQSRFLMARGFGGDAVRQVMRDARHGGAGQGGEFARDSERVSSGDDEALDRN